MAIGVVCLVLAIRLVGMNSRRGSLTPAVVGIALASVLVLDIANPEVIVARTIMDRAARTGRVDVPYLASLSGDAVPALVEMAPGPPKRDRAALSAAPCRRTIPDRFHGWRRGTSRGRRPGTPSRSSVGADRSRIDRLPPR